MHTGITHEVYVVTYVFISMRTYTYVRHHVSERSIPGIPVVSTYLSSDRHVLARTPTKNKK